MKIHNNKYTKIIKCPSCGSNYKIDTVFSINEIKERMPQFRCFDCHVRGKPLKYEMEVKNLNGE